MSEPTQPPIKQEEEQSKRPALAGQWRTPPTPFFPGDNGPLAVPAPVTSSATGVAPVVSVTTTGPPQAAAPAVTVPAPETVIPTPLPINQLPGTTEDYAKALQEAYRRGAEAAALAAQNGAVPDLTPLKVSSEDAQMMPPPPVPVVHQHHHQQAAAVVPAPAETTKPAATTKSVAQRSVSLPDMSSYAAIQEQEKRQKRLARNRASARLRRLRKKNLVDAYENEVGVLEKTIKTLSVHNWGDNNPAALTEALSMDRGQQKLDNAQRCQAATDILNQQLQFLQQLEDIMQEQYVLQQVALAQVSGTGSEFKDLADALELSDQQCQELVGAAAGWEEEWNALQTVKSSLQAMKENDWLWNEGCTEITDQFLAILHKNQISKFLLWADHNAETIDELDVVHAVNAVGDSPVFGFGVDSNPNELLEEEKAQS